MTLDVFTRLPDGARLWIYAFKKQLNDNERRIVEDRLGVFMKQWHSHQVDVDGAFAIIDDRFVILCGASRDGISGCSIDSSVENFKFFRDQHGLDALDRNLIHYRDADGEIRSIDRAAFQAEVGAGRCGPETTVFDLTIQSLGDLRAGRLERPLADSWHAQLFPPA
jgi:hypothetical protein